MIVAVSEACDDALWDRIIDLDFVVRVALCQCGQNKAISRSPAAPETSKELTEFIATSCIEDLAQEEATKLVLAGPRSDKRVPTAEQILYVLNCMTLDTD